MQIRFMCHNGIMTLLLCVVPQCQMLELGEGKKYDYYSGAGITLSFLVCQLLKYKQQLLLNTVGKCLGHKQVFTQVFVSRALEVLRRVQLVRPFLQRGIREMLAQRHLYLFSRDASQWHPKPITYLGSGTSF